MCLIHLRRHDLQEERIGAVDVEVRTEIIRHFLLRLCNDLRFSCYKKLVRRFFNTCRKIIRLDDRHVIDPGFQLGIFVRLNSGEDIICCIRQNIQPVIFS